MKKQITVEQYRGIDLTILLVVQVVCQVLIHFAANRWFADQLFVVSPVAVMTALVMMRWGGYAAIHAVVGGLIFTALAGGNAQQGLIYGVGNGLSLLTLLMFVFFDKERIRKSGFLSLMLALCIQVLMWLGRAAMAAVLGYNLEACLGFITTDVLSGLFTLVIIWAARRVDGLFEDQKNYLLRIHRQQEAEGREQF